MAAFLLFVPLGQAAAAGRPLIALALGGGAARGYSHIGLLKAFAEEGIPVDILVGTSMGSIIAGLYAAGFSPENLEWLATHVELGDLFPAMVPSRGGLVRTDRFERFLSLLTDDARIEDLAIPFYSVVVDLKTGEEVLLHKGSLSKAVVASMSIPGVFPPVEIDGAYYVDGGVASLVPARAARAVGADVVVAVDVRRPAASFDPESLIANLDLVLDHLLNANTDRQLELADVVIRPDVSGDSYMDYDRAAHFIAEGYRAAKEQIPRLREMLLSLDEDFPFGSVAPPAGFSPEELAHRVARAHGEVTRQSHVLKMTPYPEMEWGSGSRPRYRLGLDIPLWEGKDGPPVSAIYSLQDRGAGRPIHTVGVGIGSCYGLCGALFARGSSDEARWGVGLLLQGITGRWRYAAEWESRPADPVGWRLRLMTPPEDEWTAGGREIELSVGQDPRGLYGTPGEGVTAEAVYRYYFPGERANLFGLLRGSVIGYLGAGAQAFLDGSGTVDPVGEAGIVLDAHMFGLRPLRARLAAVYSGNDEPVLFRLSFGR